MKHILAALLLMLSLGTVHGKEATPMAEDPALEKRMLTVAEELRCLVCQNQTIADSHSELATDLRQQIREQLKRGMNEQQIVDYMVERYGDFVRYRPPIKPSTLLLWFGPLVLFVGGGAILYYNLSKRRKQIVEAPLTDEENKRVQALLGEADKEIKA